MMGAGIMAATTKPVRPAPRADSQILVDVVIPVLNEAHVLEQSVGTVRTFLAQNAKWAWRVVIVDNGSVDGTDKVARRLAEAHADVRFLQLPLRGRGRALRQAWSQSDADILCYMDVDLSTELAALPRLVDGVLHEGYDLGTGSRLLPRSRTTRSFKREVISRIYNLIVKASLRSSFSDAQCGFKVVARYVVQDVVPRIEDESWFFDTELLVRAERLGYRIMDLPVEWKEDDDSRVKIAKTAWDDLKGIARLRLEFWGLSRPAAPRAVPAVSEPAESVNLTPP
jgi:glycosyltransferase involved in cell wall biosynthesis